VLFDGVCNLCNNAVQFIIKRDPSAKIKFASLQSPFGKSQLIKHDLDPETLLSIIVIDNDVVLKQSDAALIIASKLTGPWPALGVFKFIPRFIRDAVYNFIARRRYSWYGKRDSCMIPDEGLRGRFIE
jgi:predicted DCC family thiol-disulfide oxidoreductase YuxK